MTDPPYCSTAPRRSIIHQPISEHSHSGEKNSSPAKVEAEIQVKVEAGVKVKAEAEVDAEVTAVTEVGGATANTEVDTKFDNKQSEPVSTLENKEEMVKKGMAGPIGELSRDVTAQVNHQDETVTIDNVAINNIATNNVAIDNVATENVAIDNFSIDGNKIDKDTNTYNYNKTRSDTDISHSVKNELFRREEIPENVSKTVPDVPLEVVVNISKESPSVDSERTSSTNWKIATTAHHHTTIASSISSFSFSSSSAT